MPIIHNSSYPGPARFQFNGHLQTLIPGMFRRIKGVDYQRERIETSDGDFLDIDWLTHGNRRLVILTHGLEGSSAGQYIRGTARHFTQHGWDALAWNCRSCSGEMNRRFRMYHHGDTEDIDAIVQHALKTGRYDVLVLVGYSMGGNITMKYLGTKGDQVAPQVKAGVAFSSPCDIAAGADVLDRWDNFIYKKRFMGFLERKIRLKNKQFPGHLDVSKLRKVRRWHDFDEWFSAPICGFRSAAEFHQQASAKNFLEGIRIPVLLVNAANDPILTPECFPFDIAEKHPWFHFELAPGGGHCGFRARGDRDSSWSERRALEFCVQHGNTDYTDKTDLRG
ncbi:MAG: alpha/beta fold hydrolase [Bacteroidetes bacterium]|nr:alpha/beta fold hydrolase [Bacteroidota bacterium]